MPVQVKICGITTIDAAIASMESGADFLGFNFSPESKRQVGLKAASEIMNEIEQRKKDSLSIVGLFYKNSLEEMKTIISEIPFDFVQFVTHDESLSLDLMNGLHKKLIPQVSVKGPLSDKDLEKFKTELIILDSYKAGMGGGSGIAFEWENVKLIKRKYLLAGGLNPSNVEKAIRELRPFGVDVASGVESSPGKKDTKLIEEFIKNAKRI